MSEHDPRLVGVVLDLCPSVACQNHRKCLGDPCRLSPPLAEIVRATRDNTAPTPADPDIMTVTEGAAFLRISRTSLYDAIGRGEVPHRKIGRQIRLSKVALVKWLEGVRPSGGSCGPASKGI